MAPGWALPPPLHSCVGLLPLEKAGGCPAGSVLSGSLRGVPCGSSDEKEPLLGTSVGGSGVGGVWLASLRGHLSRSLCYRQRPCREIRRVAPLGDQAPRVVDTAAAGQSLTELPLVLRCSRLPVGCGAEAGRQAWAERHLRGECPACTAAFWVTPVESPALPPLLTSHVIPINPCSRGWRRLAAVRSH